MKSLAFDCSIPADHPSLVGHFPGRPIVPGVLLLDLILARLEQEASRRVLAVNRVKFSSVLRPSETAEALFETEGAHVSFRVMVRGGGGTAQVLSGSLLLAAERDDSA